MCTYNRRERSNFVLTFPFPHLREYEERSRDKYCCKLQRVRWILDLQIKLQIRWCLFKKIAAIVLIVAVAFSFPGIENGADASKPLAMTENVTLLVVFGASVR